MKDATSTSILQVVCAIIVHPTRKGVCLAAQRAMTDKNLPGKWEFPGGKIEPAETAEDALVREIREELNIEVEVLRPLTPILHAYPSFSIRLIPFTCGILSGVLNGNEHDKVEWVDVEDLHQLEWAPADVPIVEEWARMAKSV